METQVRRWMPFLAVDNVSIIQTPDRNKYTIKVDFHFIKNPNMFDSIEITTAAGV